MPVLIFETGCGDIYFVHDSNSKYPAQGRHATILFGKKYQFYSTARLRGSAIIAKEANQDKHK
jgi:hypothetical protein